jgi:hypothetical protein
MESFSGNFLLALATSTFRLLPRKPDCKQKVLGEKTVAHAARLRPSKRSVRNRFHTQMDFSDLVFHEMQMCSLHRKHTCPFIQVVAR